MKFKIKFLGKEKEIQIEEIDDKKITVLIEGEKFFFEKDEKGEVKEIEKPFEKKEEKKVLISEGKKEKIIKAPIAGIVYKIFVKEGDEVFENQKVMSLFSMKMENEILSEFSGKVKKIFVKENQRVKENDPLLLME